MTKNNYDRKENKLISNFLNESYSLNGLKNKE
jgi:hypothetical protein